MSAIIIDDDFNVTEVFSELLEMGFKENCGALGGI